MHSCLQTQRQKQQQTFNICPLYVHVCMSVFVEKLKLTFEQQIKSFIMNKRADLGTLAALSCTDRWQQALKPLLC